VREHEREPCGSNRKKAPDRNFKYLYTATMCIIGAINTFRHHRRRRRRERKLSLARAIHFAREREREREREEGRSLLFECEPNDEIEHPSCAFGFYHSACTRRGRVSLQLPILSLFSRVSRDSRCNLRRHFPSPE